METLTTPTSIEPRYLYAVWAVDPSEEKLRPHTEALEEVRRLLGGAFINVRPVYVCPQEQLQDSKLAAKVQDYLKPMRLGPTPPVEILYSKSNKRGEWAEQISQYAVNENAELILLTSHGRSSIGAFFLGSFARELLQKSAVPLFFVNPKVAETPHEPRALFATDFSEASKNSFDRFLDFIKDKTNDLILYHAVSYPISSLSAAQWAGGAAPIPDSLLEDQKEWADRETERWILEARQKGLRTQFYSVVEETFSSPSLAIGKIAERENVTVIGLASHVGPLARMALGSVTQDLLAAQKFHIWACGPQCVQVGQSPRFH